MILIGIGQLVLGICGFSVIVRSEISNVPERMEITLRMFGDKEEGLGGDDNIRLSRNNWRIRPSVSLTPAIGNSQPAIIVPNGLGGNYGGIHGSGLGGGPQDFRKDNNQVVDVNLFVTQMFVSSRFKDNMITVFGYLLNMPKNPLSRDLFSSLYLIQEALLTKRVIVFEMITKLKSLFYASPLEQFIIIFTEIQKLMPKYLIGTTIVWLEELQNKRLPVNDWLRPNGGALIVDFLSGIDCSLYESLSMTLQFKQEPMNSLNPVILEQMGKPFAHMFNRIFDGSVVITPQLLAVILLHLPGEIIPHKEETIVFLCDKLRGNLVQDFKMKLTVSDKKDHVTLVRAVLTTIAETPGESVDIRNSAKYLLPYIKHTLSTSSSSYYVDLYPVVSKPSIDLPLLLKSVQGPEYPIDIIDLSKRIIQYIQLSYLNLEEISLTFMRHRYNKPIDILIAFLTKMQYITPTLDEEILAHIKGLQMYLIFRKIHCNLVSQLPEDFINYSDLVEDLNSPVVPASIREIGKNLKEFLMKEKVDLNSIAKITALEECSRPRQCIVTLINKAVVQGLIKSKPIIRDIKILLEELGPDGNPRVQPSSGGNSPAPNNLSSSVTSPNSQTGNAANFISPEGSGAKNPGSQLGSQLSKSPSGNVPDIYPMKPNKLNENTGGVPESPEKDNSKPKTIFDDASYKPSVNYDKPNGPGSDAVLPDVGTKPSSPTPPWTKTVDKPLNLWNSQAVVPNMPGSIGNNPKPAPFDRNLAPQPFDSYQSVSKPQVIPSGSAVKPVQPNGGTEFQPNQSKSDSAVKPTQSNIPTISQQQNQQISDTQSSKPDSDKPNGGVSGFQPNQPKTGTAVKPDQSNGQIIPQQQNQQIPSTKPNPPNLSQPNSGVPGSQPNQPKSDEGVRPDQSNGPTISQQQNQKIIPTGSQPDETNSAQPANVLKPVSNGPDGYPPNQSQDKIDSSMKDYMNIPFPPIDDTANLPPNIDLPGSLIPQTEPHTPQDIKVRPIRMFLIQANLFKLLGPSFQPTEYKTRLLLLIAILKQSLQLSIDIVSIQLRKCIEEYLAYLVQSKSDTAVKPDQPNSLTISQQQNQKIIPTGSQPDETNSAQPANVLKPVSNGPDGYPPNQSQDKIDSSMKDYMNIPFPPIDDTANLPPNIDLPGSLIPQTEPHTPQDIKVRPIRMFLIQANLFKLLGPSFQPTEYETRLLLLIAILKQSLQLSIDIVSIQLRKCIEEYLAYLLQNSGTKMTEKMSVVWMSTINALQPPTNSEEKAKYQVIINFLSKPDLPAILGDDFNPTQYQTNGQLLKSLFEYLLNANGKFDSSLLDSLRFYSKKISMNGYGAQSIQFGVTYYHYSRYTYRKSVIEKTVDLNSVFLAINKTKENLVQFKNVKLFFAKEFDPEKHMSGFDFQAYLTKGTWLQAFFTFLFNNQYVTPLLKADIAVLLNYIVFTGAGAEEVSYIR